MNINILKKLGLSEKEINVYLALLEYGAGSVRKIAEISGINRGTTYDILKDLQKIGLVSFYHKDTKQKFVAENPEKILKVLNDKQEELQETKKQVAEIIPELKALQEKEGNKPVTKFYEGKEGIKFILDDILEAMASTSLPQQDPALSDSQYYVYSAASVRDDVYNAYPDFTKKRIKNNIKVKTISLSKGGDTYGLDERKWLKTEQDSPTYIIIYANKCAFISRDNSNNPVGVIIENKMIYETEKLIFMNLWEKI